MTTLERLSKQGLMALTKKFRRIENESLLQVDWFAGSSELILPPDVSEEVTEALEKQADPQLSWPFTDRAAK